MLSIPLRSGSSIPALGLGVWQTPRGGATAAAVTAAIQAGYRHVDTARIYGNENEVGDAVRASALPRSELFVTTKLWNADQGYDATLRAFDASLSRLGLDYVDLYLIHWPVPGKRLDSWRALEKLHADGRARAIGVSNFLRRHLEELLAVAKVVPHVNQIELTPFLQRRETTAYCKEHGIVVEAYSPLTRGQKLSDPTVLSVARRLGRTPAQVLLRWGLAHGFVVLPKSTQAARIRENAALFDFEIGPADLSLLDGLEAGLVTGWDPASER
jgi:diketogulonate reductase-like aldo/keto reductase